ncbi:MAG TPA: hypothetical protein P5281_01100 [Anaerovoracaceae bacterium]|nr:hypothetical protein [Anaerovoracaceae bacterium]
MSFVKYTLTAPRPSDHKVEVLRRSCCPALAEASLFTHGEELAVTVRIAGLFHLKTYLEHQDASSEDHRLRGGQVPEILGWLRRVTEAMDLAAEYLIEEKDISLALEDLYFDAKEGPARLLLKSSDGTLIEGLISLCGEMYALCPDSNADLVARRLRERNAEQLMERRTLLAYLSGWACELNGQCGR